MKIALTVFAVALVGNLFQDYIFSPVFASLIGQELFGINEALADHKYGKMDVTITS